MSAANYKDVVLGLVFLKYISDSFEELYSKIKEGKGDFVGANPENPDEYRAENVFFVPLTARWSHLLSRAKLPSIGKDIDNAMEAIEKETPMLKGILPKIFVLPNLHKPSLGELIDLIGKIAIGTEAGKRFALEQYNKQINLENIIIGARERLEGEEVSDQPVDKDWSFRFRNIAQDVSREDMQELFSKILTEEIKQPNTFSLRTLDFVKNLNKADLLLFKKIAIITSQNFSAHIPKSNANEGFLNISYGEIMQMIEAGFVQSSITTVLKLGDVVINQNYVLALKNGMYYFKFIEEQKNVTLPVLQLTTIGKEIASLIELENGDEKIISEYIEELKEYWKTKKNRICKIIKS